MNETTSSIRVLITEDHPVTRLGLRGVVNAQTDMTVVGEAESSAELMNRLDDVWPDVLLLDFMLPDGDGFQVVRELSETRLPHTLIISMCEEEMYARRAFRLGALGYIMKNAPAEELVRAIRTVAEGELYASQAIKDRIFKMAINPTSHARDDALDTLSDREIEVLAHLGRREGNVQIAEMLGLNDRTIATYKVRLRDKLNCQTMEELEKEAVRLVTGES